MLAAGGLAPRTAAAQDPMMHDHSHAEAGEPGKPEAVTRTLQVKLGDSFFEPATVRARPGETVRFVLINRGELLHEFTIGTPAMHAEHQKEMSKMAEQGLITPTGIVADPHAGHGMPGPAAATEHDHPGGVMVKPGETRELIWTFPQSGVLEFACNLPGHYESGMVGDIMLGR
jgi:uncharacterized cupredoxin-like copper-binding protein